MQVLEAAAKDPASAAELPWQRRLSMASACSCCCAGWLSGRWPAAAALQHGCLAPVHFLPLSQPMICLFEPLLPT